MNKDVLAAQIRYHENAAARLRAQQAEQDVADTDLDSLHPDDFDRADGLEV